jgi:hypothetical protein
MANEDKANGFIPVSNAPINKYSPQKGYLMTASQTVYPGDVVKLVNAGTVEEADADDGEAVIGVAAEYKAAAASGNYYLKVYDDPTTVFVVQTDTDTASTAADVGETANHVAGAGVAASKTSGHELDASQMAASGGAQFNVLGLYDAPGNAWGVHSKVLVSFNEHRYKAAGTAV